MTTLETSAGVIDRHLTAIHSDLLRLLFLLNSLLHGCVLRGSVVTTIEQELREGVDDIKEKIIWVPDTRHDIFVHHFSLATWFKKSLWCDIEPKIDEGQLNPVEFAFLHGTVDSSGYNVDILVDVDLETLKAALEEEGVGFAVIDVSGRFRYMSIYINQDSQTKAFGRLLSSSIAFSGLVNLIPTVGQPRLNRNWDKQHSRRMGERMLLEFLEDPYFHIVKGVKDQASSPEEVLKPSLPLPDNPLQALHLFARFVRTAILHPPKEIDFGEFYELSNLLEIGASAPKNMEHVIGIVANLFPAWLFGEEKLMHYLELLNLTQFFPYLNSPERLKEDLKKVEFNLKSLSSSLAPVYRDEEGFPANILNLFRFLPLTADEVNGLTFTPRVVYVYKKKWLW